MIITFCIVAFNEEKTISKLLNNLLSQTYDRKKTEVLFVDGMSTDRTKAVFLDFAQKYSNDYYKINVLDNPGKTLPCGWNVALENYTGDAIVRVDAHAEIPSDFIERNVFHLSSGDMVCGGFRPNIIDEKTPWKETLLAAESSMFGSSIADYRRQGSDRKVKSIFHGAYMREVFERVGKYNENLARTEDNDMHYRIIKAGYDIWFHPDIISLEHTRNTIKGMIRQKYLNGYWIGRTLGIQPGCVSVFYLVPAAFVVAIIVTSLLAYFGSSMLAVMMWVVYLSLCVIMTITAFASSETNHPHYVLIPLIFVLLHLAYGIGTIKGIIAMITRKVKGE